MSISMSGQAMSLAGALALGAVLGLIYDLFRISRLAVPMPSALIAAEDILYYTISGAIIFSYLMEASDGRVRGFILIGTLCGWLLYHCTAGELVMAASGKIIALIRRLLRILLTPLAYAAGFLCGYCKKAAVFCAAGAQQSRNRLKSTRSMMYNYIHRIVIRIRGGRKRRSAVRKGGRHNGKRESKKAKRPS